MGKNSTKYAPVGVADVYGKHTAALFTVQWPLRLAVHAVWVSSEDEHIISPWQVTTRRERPGFCEYADTHEWRATDERMKVNMSALVASMLPAYLEETALRKYAPMDGSPLLVLHPFDVAKIRVTRGLFDHRRKPTPISVVLELEEVAQ